MDRFFLSALVRELAGRVIGARARDVRRWQGGFSIALNLTPPCDLVVSWMPQAPGLYLGAPPPWESEAASPVHFARLLKGGELVELKAESLDRVLRLTWERLRPSGVRLRVELIVEWVGGRSGAYLIEEPSRRLLVVMSSGRPRLRPGERFEPLAPPPGVAPVARDASELEERLRQARQRGLKGPEAVRAAGGLSPPLAEDVWMLHTERGMTLRNAFELVRSKLEDEPTPVLLRPSETFRDEGGRFRLSPISLSERPGEQIPFDSLNEAARAFVDEAAHFMAARQRYRALRGALKRRLKKKKSLLERMERDREAVDEPARLRRWAELLLAGLHRAKQVDGGVEVDDPYHPGGGRVRVPLDPRWGILRNAERYFRKSRKAETSLEHIGARMRRLKEEIAYLETLELSLEHAEGAEAIEAIAAELGEKGLVSGRAKRGTKLAGAPKPLSPRTFVGTGGCVIFAGRSARSNEELTFDVAKPHELWFHSAGVAGSHVVLRLPSKGEPSAEQIREAAAVAAFYSKARGATAVEVVYTPRRHVRKIPGAPPGTVRLARHQSVRVRPGVPPSGRSVRENGPSPLGPSGEG